MRQDRTRIWERASPTQRQTWRRKLLDIDTFARDVYMILKKAKGAFLMAGNADMRMMYCFAMLHELRKSWVGFACHAMALEAFCS